MLASFWQKGEFIDFVNETESVIPANTVVSLNTRVGIAGTDIQPGEKGSLALEGVYKMTKTSTEKITLGTEVYFDGTGITMETESATKTANIPVGYAVETSPKGSTEILVKLIG